VIAHDLVLRLALRLSNEYDLTWRQCVNLQGVIDKMGRGGLSFNQVEDILLDLFTNVIAPESTLVEDA
jgi:hypothetical protein